MKTLRLLLLCPALALAQPNVASGKYLFERNCTMCHGSNGGKGRFGAADLRRSALSDPDYRQVIANGRRVMPQWKRRLSAGQIDQIIAYIKTLRP
jgi:mono/diheme cytochrome c family protein